MTNCKGKSHKKMERIWDNIKKIQTNENISTIVSLYNKYEVLYLCF